MDIKGKTAVVTGATGGLGWRICLALAKEGARLCLVYGRSKEKAEDHVKELASLGCEAVAVSADVTKEEGIDRMFAAAVTAFGGIDILVLDAAYNETIPFRDLETLDADKWSFIVDYNLKAPYLAARKVAPFMKKRGGGRIVTISSVAGAQPMGSSIAYAVSKAGVTHLAKCLAVALAPEILVNDVAPGLMEGTGMTGKLSEEQIKNSLSVSLLKRAADKDDVADAVAMFIRSDSITGQSLVVDAGRVFK
ncbi:MAG: SDR family NAD(P)-dependent oxidoreductase [Treponemataceae bacterium]